VANADCAQGLCSSLSEQGVKKVKSFVFDRTFQGDGKESEQYSEDRLNTWIEQNRPELLMGNSVVTERDFGYPALKIDVYRPCGVIGRTPVSSDCSMGIRGYLDLRNRINIMREAAGGGLYSITLYNSHVLKFSICKLCDTRNPQALRKVPGDFFMV